MRSTTKISRCLNLITQENLLTDNIIPNPNYSHEDDWKRLRRYVY
ncbi:hypothetical protein Q4Q34_16830 [Flavivirga abyssicola]|nr:hypothetical protein [Flavivirga sp. MEBiC07777]WVK12881.1 hypothetical protein Q4Q34_16830 [Flavivirga sp. MEBiC07777]